MGDMRMEWSETKFRGGLVGAYIAEKLHTSGVTTEAQSVNRLQRGQGTITMNKKNCESLAYILSIFPHSSEMRDAIFKIDDRIKVEYEGFASVVERRERVEERFAQLMEEKFGNTWPLNGNTKVHSRMLWEQAENEIPEL